MNRILLALTLCLVLVTSVRAQKQKNKKALTGDDKELLAKIVDSTTLLRQFSQNACDCIDSMGKTEKDKNKKMNGIADCIDKEVGAYQLSVKLFGSLTSSNNKISIFTDKNSSEYKHYYYALERRLKDSCAVMNAIISNNDEAREKSYSSNADAMDAYNKGVNFMAKENYEECIPLFEKAVAIDSEFAFAWDNLGVCYRKTGKYEKAENAYKNSLKVDPRGKTALQNLAVVYLKQNKDNEAIAAYLDILKYYPDDPEVYYGIGVVYYSNKNDMQNALEYMCKAYNIYNKEKSPYRSDAEKVINLIYVEMKKNNQEDNFSRILKENNIKSN